MPIVLEMVDPGNEVVWANGRLPDRVNAYRSYIANWERDAGHPARYVCKVFDEREDLDENDDWEWTEYVMSTTPGGRKQIRLQVARHAGAVREIVLQRVPTAPQLHQDGDDAAS